MSKNQIQPATLYIVATPIGNLDDISVRAQKVLASVDAIIAEDTRHTLKLLTALGVKQSLTSLHAHNENTESQRLIERLQAGESLALVSDAGTPLISDPGFLLVKLAREQGIAVCPIPGASAVVTALSASGLACDHFSFEGFLPAKRSGRQLALEELKDEHRTLVFYESPRRVLAMLRDVSDVFSDDRMVCVARELTKLHEELFTGSVAAAMEWLVAKPRERGEFVVIIAGAEKKPATEFADSEKLLTHLLTELSVKSAAKIAADVTGHPKKELYKLALALKDQQVD